MGLIQNKVTVSQPNSHVVVKNAGGLRGLTGETGQQGPQGVPGEAATVTAGTTTTLPAGSNATVQNVGSTSAAIFNFGIPKGDKGDTGESGAAATISVGTTTTLEPGEDATVTNSGTSSAAVFDFGIPKGAKGDTGSQGPAGQDGADGFSPTATVSKTGDTATITITDKDGTTTAQISDGTTPTIDPALSPTSENPVQNKVVTNALAGKADKPIFVSSLPATGTEGQEYLVDDRYNTVTEIKGDTEQTTYSGKNLYEGSPSFNAFSGISGYEDGGTYNGIPVVKRAAAWGGIYRLINIESGVTYTFSSWVKSDEARPVAIYATGSGSTATITPANKSITTSTSWERVSFTFACSTSGTIALRFENTSASTTNYTYISGYQLEKNSSATSFEPYVGGTASPNPDYPQEVQTVTGEQTITVSNGQGESQAYPINLGKNLLNPATLTADSRLNGDGTLLSGATGFSTSDYIPVEPNTTYTITRNAASSGFFGNLCQYNSSKALVGTREYWDNTASYWPYHITTSSTTRYIRVSDQTTLFGTSFQIEKGSTATTYAPYVTAFGKNLLNPNTFVKGRIDSGVVGYASDTSALSNTENTITFTTTANYRGAASDFIAVDAETQYRLQQQLQSGTSNYVDFYDTSKTWISRATSNPFTTPQDCGYVRVSYQGNSAGTYTVTNPQLEKGSITTTYEPNMSGQLELCKIGTYQDYIYKSGEDWYVHKETGKVTFTGAETETWSSATAATGYVRFSTASGKTHADNNGYCNELINRGSQSHGAYEYVWVQPNANAFYIQVLNTRANDLSSFRTWLGANPATVYYDISTPTDMQITDAALIAQLEALAGAKIMVDGGTATVTSQYLPAALTTAYNSNSGYIDYIYDGTNFVKVR